METIKISVSGNLTSAVIPTAVVAGTVGLTVEFSFDPSWEDLRKTAVFRAGGRTLDVLDAEQTVEVPWELLRKAGCRLWAGVYGTNEDGTVQIPTVWTDLGVILPGADPSGDESADPSSPVWEQARKDIDGIYDTVGDLSKLTTVEKSSLVASVNELAGSIPPIKRVTGTRSPEDPSMSQLPSDTYILDGRFFYNIFDSQGVTFQNKLVNVGHSEKRTFLVYFDDIGRLVRTSLIGAQVTTKYLELDKLETTANRVTAIDSASDDQHYPTAKAVYDCVGSVESALDSIIAIQESLIGGDGQ